MADPHFIPIKDRAAGEGGEDGLPSAEAEEREAEKSAPEILADYRARMREVEELLNPPPDQPWPTQAAADMIARGEWPPRPEMFRAPLRAHFNERLGAGRWEAFGFSEAHGARVRIGSPWRDNAAQGYVEILFYRVSDTDADVTVAAWVEREWAAGRGVKPDLESNRAACTAAVGFEVTRDMLRAANKHRRRPGRPKSSR